MEVSTCDAGSPPGAPLEYLEEMRQCSRTHLMSTTGAYTFPGQELNKAAIRDHLVLVYNLEHDAQYLPSLEERMCTGAEFSRSRT